MCFHGGLFVRVPPVVLSSRARALSDHAFIISYFS